MEIKAEQKFVRMSARKVRFVADSIRNQSPKDALEQLEFIRRRAAEPLIKVIKQALANATNNYGQKEEGLMIHRIEVVEGPTYKRWQAVSRGRAHSIFKRTCHIAVFLKSDDKESQIAGNKSSAENKKTTELNTKEVKQTKATQKVKEVNKIEKKTRK